MIQRGLKDDPAVCANRNQRPQIKARYFIMCSPSLTSYYDESFKMSLDTHSRLISFMLCFSFYYNVFVGWEWVPTSEIDVFNSRMIHLWLLIHRGKQNTGTKLKHLQREMSNLPVVLRSHTNIKLWAVGQDHRKEITQAVEMNSLHVDWVCEKHGCSRRDLFWSSCFATLIGAEWEWMDGF